MTPYWWRSFSSERDVTYFGGAPVLRELEAVRDILDESKDHVTEKPRTSIRERLCWIASGALLSWLAWAVMNAANSAPGP